MTLWKCVFKWYIEKRISSGHPWRLSGAPCQGGCGLATPAWKPLP